MDVRSRFPHYWVRSCGPQAAALKPRINLGCHLRPQIDLYREQSVDFEAAQLPTCSPSSESVRLGARVNSCRSSSSVKRRPMTRSTVRCDMGLRILMSKDGQGLSPVTDTGKRGHFSVFAGDWRISGLEAAAGQPRLTAQPRAVRSCASSPWASARMPTGSSAWL